MRDSATKTFKTKREMHTYDYDIGISHITYCNYDTLSLSALFILQFRVYPSDRSHPSIHPRKRDKYNENGMQKADNRNAVRVSIQKQTPKEYRLQFGQF